MKVFFLRLKVYAHKLSLAEPRSHLNYNCSFLRLFIYILSHHKVHITTLPLNSVTRDEKGIQVIREVIYEHIPSVNFINIFCARFLYESYILAAFSSQKSTFVRKKTCEIC